MRTVPRMFGLAFTQPDKVHLKEAADPDWPHALALLLEMSTVFAGFDARMEALQEEMRASAHIHEAALQLVQELADGVHMLSLRALQLHQLYRSRDPATPAATVSRLQLQSRAVLKMAQGRRGPYTVKLTLQCV